MKMVNPKCMNEYPTAEEKRATGRALCRICGERIEKGEKEVIAPMSFQDGGSYNAWQAVDCHFHRTCWGDNWIEYTIEEPYKEYHARRV